MAHLCLDHPTDARACAVSDEYMLGRELLVAPIVCEGAESREVYLPQGQWRGYFTGDRYEGGRAYEIACDWTRIPVFRRVEGGAAHERA